ncbi:amidohydrolase family protein [Hymenobacter sp. BRD128]|uniref:amidohydrolase family protein n=1 Tax=Hymenobacter sp. BRD128 TaxID=2675878 RepID=UPI001565D8E6|nr:amidohydrolase family protein [Hymenobacter sp. BRD128]QKG55270.1 amidohydrolase family protein [Hymenobacter sp. BRD128]
MVPALAAHAATLAATWALPDSLRCLAPAGLRQQWTEAAGRQQRASAAGRASRPALDSVRGRLLAELLRQRVTIVAGSDAGAATPGLLYGTGLVTELELLVAAGLTPAQALRAATVAPAMITGHYSDLGRIEPGYRADMVLLAANPLTDIRHLRQVASVLQGGYLLDRGALAALVAQATQAARAGALPPTAAVRKVARRPPVPSPAASK